MEKLNGMYGEHYEEFKFLKSRVTVKTQITEVLKLNLLIHSCVRKIIREEETLYLTSASEEAVTINYVDKTLSVKSKHEYRIYSPL